MPPRISSSVTAPAATPISSGAVQHDIDRKGSDSYYYAHARNTDYQVPTVPKKIAADGSLTPWRPEPAGPAHIGPPS